MKDIRELENKTANASLHNVYLSAKQFSMKPLTNEEKKELIKRSLINPKDYKVEDDEKL